MRKILFFLLMGLSSPLLAVTAIGPAVGTIQNRNTLQDGATFYVSSGTVVDLSVGNLLIRDQNSHVDLSLGQLPVNSGYGPQVVQDYLWNKTNMDGTTVGGFSIVSTTISKTTTSGGAPLIAADGSAWILGPVDQALYFYSSENPFGTLAFKASRETNSSDFVDIQGGTVTAVSGDFSNNVTAPRYYFAPSTYLNFTGSQVCLYVLSALQECWPSVVTASYLLLESGDFALLETGDKFILE